MVVYRVYDIQFDTDGDLEQQREMKETYGSMYFLIKKKNFEPAEELADKISDATGYCVFGYKFELIQLIK